MLPDGSDRRRLTEVGTYMRPAWSPTREAIAVVRSRTSLTGRNRIVVMGASGQKPTVVATARFEIQSLSWAPGGKRLVYCDLDVNNPEGASPYPSVLRVVDVATRTQTRITSWGERACGPKWSPTGSWIAYSAGDTTDLDIFAIKPDGTQGHVVFSDPESRQLDVTWSPSGRRLGFGSTVPERHGDVDAAMKLQTVRLDGTGLRTLTQPEDFFDRMPQWSPDGKRLLFFRQDAALFGEAQLAVVNPDGTDLQVLVPAEMRDAVWSPDSTKILYSRRGNIYVVVPGGEPTLLVGSARLFDSGVSWRQR